MDRPTSSHSARPMEEGRPARPGHMPTPMVPAQNAAMTIGDIYYVVFRHKWKIFLCTLTGMIGAVGFVFLFPQPFQSDAKLFVRYVVTDTKTPAAPGADMSKYTSPDQRGETIMESEQEILTSLDLAKQVAETVGPE
ncbi:MAG TPA: Wzz/FepE/Etk N-terminal domain-containing protein, partial [Opitutaceae bacterium]|nr:Wzz/FepE/Etk N-terminal domain-containing protein [Opitutaceae bacterium]